MMKQSILLSLVGAALLGGFGTRIAILTSVGSLSLAAFALGIIMMAQAPTVALRERVRRLEDELKVRRELGTKVG